MLGLINKQITGPLWRIIENEDIHILDMGGIMKEVIQNLETTVTDPEDFLRGNVTLCSRNEWIIKKM